MRLQHGVFIISLDFELYWGVRDNRSIAEYRENLDGVRQAVPALLEAFRARGIHATWATVGFLFCRDAEELRRSMPGHLPHYRDPTLSPYRYIARAGELEPAYHFAPELIELIRQHPHQEIASHTFSHYLCLERGQSRAEFESDLHAAVSVARRRGVVLKSLVPPKNQWNAAYREALIREGIRCYRGNEGGWLYRACADVEESRLQRALRLLDAYLNLTGHHTHAFDHVLPEPPFDFPASRFLRPWSARLAALDGLRLARITRAMDDAARRHRLFHLWWHPHNFGANTAQNLAFLEKILDHYRRLQQTHGLQSLNMGELCELAGASRPAADRRPAASALPSDAVQGHSG